VTGNLKNFAKIFQLRSLLVPDSTVVVFITSSLPIDSNDMICQSRIEATGQPVDQRKNKSPPPCERIPETNERSSNACIRYTLTSIFFLRDTHSLVLTTELAGQTVRADGSK
jgi:hypothetical protein